MSAAKTALDEMEKGEFKRTAAGFRSVDRGTWIHPMHASWPCGGVHVPAGLIIQCLSDSSSLGVAELLFWQHPFKCAHALICYSSCSSTGVRQQNSTSSEVTMQEH